MHFRPQERSSWKKGRHLNLLNDYTFAVSHMMWPIKIPSLLITLPVDICNEMTDHFSKVFSDGSEDDFDNNFK